MVVAHFFLSISIFEGFDMPSRLIDKDLLDYLKVGAGGHIELTGKEKKKKSAIDKKHKHRKSYEPDIARRNFSLCEDTDQYHSCDVEMKYRPSIDQRYLTLPATKLDPSNIYNHSSLCPQAYSTNMDKLNKKKTVGQYSGYTENAYVDRTRYIDTKEGKEPLPMNPDFFMKGGGTYA